MGGRDQSERLVAINRNSWSGSSGARKPGYVANKEADKRRKETKERLQQREREFAERQQPPSIVLERLRAS